MNNRPIGVLDSGIGGLTIWREIVRLLPKESTIYIADSKNCPYGKKTPEQIHAFAKRLIKFLLKKDVKLIVIACNTITVSCLDKLREEFTNVPIVGTVPVIKTASEQTKNGIIGIFSTSGTAKSMYQKSLINKFAKDKTVINIGTDKLVPMIEKGKSMYLVIKKILLPFKKTNIDVLALGCSHYPLIREQIQRVLGLQVVILDSGAAIARQVRRVLSNNNSLSSLKIAAHSFFTTGDKELLNHVLSQQIGYNAKEIARAIL